MIPPNSFRPPDTEQLAQWLAGGFNNHGGHVGELIQDGHLITPAGLSSRGIPPQDAGRRDPPPPGSPFNANPQPRQINAPAPRGPDHYGGGPPGGAPPPAPPPPPHHGAGNIPNARPPPQQNGGFSGRGPPPGRGPQQGGGKKNPCRIDSSKLSHMDCLRRHFVSFRFMCYITCVISIALRIKNID
jgi:hypothetical protein